VTALSSDSRVCALIPHYRCEQWLGQAIESLLEQTRPPDAIVVIDDASEHPPVETVEQYPEVTLLAAAENSGPYRLVQAVIDATRFDAYLFQDADDWSAPDRLQILLSEAAATGAELIGSHEVRVLVDQGDVIPVRYPLDVNAELRDRPTAFPLLHPTSLISRTLVCRLGGFATGMRFSGDAELLRRAGHVARIINADHFGYFRRKRQGSLTLGSDTALGSPARQEVQAALAERASENAEAVTTGGVPDLRPWRTAPPVVLSHLAGPRCNTSARRPSRTRRPDERPSSAAPIFVLGAPRSGHAVLGWALGQHPSLHVLPDGRWLARAASDVTARAEQEAAPVPSSFRTTLSGALRSLMAEGSSRPVAAGTELLDAAHALAELFPGAQFIHVIRDVEGAVAALAAAPTTDGAYYTGDRAWSAWLAATEQGLLVEEALGSEIVLRVRYRELVEHPRAVVDRCLAFVGEEPAAACVRPVTELAADESLAPTVASTIPALCQEVSRLPREQPSPLADRAAREQLRSRFQRAQRRRGLEGESLVERARDFLMAAAPEGSTVAVISRGDPRMVELDGRRAWHFPQVEDGTYAGHHPADGRQALDQLTSLAERGADHLAIPASSLWWLTWYDELREYLTSSATLVAFHEEVAAIYRLQAPAAAPDDRKPSAPRFGAVPARQEVAP
jgi:hypothetical protein